MSKLFIFSIGGSGSRVIRALNMLLASGVPQFKSGDQIFPIMIDYDVHNGDTERATRCVRTYHNLHKYAYPKTLEATSPTEGRFFHTPMMEMKDPDGIGGSRCGFTMQFRHNPDDRTFGAAIAYDKLIEDKQKTKDLLKSLYDVSSTEDTELGIDMTVGFKGNPNIGSVVFHSLKDKDEFADFYRSYQPDQGDKVILIGSLFGGTGSSGIPAMVKAIRDQEGGADVKLGVIMILPYFCFDKKEENGTVKGALFDAKTRAALGYYNTDNMLDRKINTTYFIGDNERTKVPYSQGGSTQKNNSHLVDLIGAISILHFMGRDNSELGKKFKYRMHDNEPDQAPGFTVLNFYKWNLEAFLRPLITMAFAIKFVESEIAKKTKVVTDRPWNKGMKVTSYFDNDGHVQKPAGDVAADKVNLQATLYYFMEFCTQFKEWVKELTDIGNHKLMLFDFEREIDAIVQDCRLSDKKGFWGSSQESPIVKPLDFSEQMQKCYAKNYADAAPSGGDLHFTKTTAGYAFLDILRCGVDAVLSKDDVARKLKFK